MDPTDAFALVTRTLADELGVPAEKITLQANLRDDLEMDSLDRAEFVAALEGAMDVKIDDEVIGRVHVVNDVVDAIVSGFGDSRQSSAS